MVIPFFSFRIMVGCWLVMLLVAWVGSYLIHKGRIEQNRLLLWATFLSFPLPFIAILTGWFTAEVGRQPWVVYGVLRTADAMTPFLTARTAAISLPSIASSTASSSRSEPTTSIGCCALDQRGAWFCPPPPQFPTARCRSSMSTTSRRRSSRPRRRIAVVMFWVAILAVSILLYVLLDGFDLGVGMLFGLTRDEKRRRAMMSAVAPIWDGNETWLVVAGGGALGRFSGRLCDASVGVLSAAAADAGGADPARRRVRIS